MTTKASLEEAIRDTLDDEPRQRASHPSKERLLDLVRGQVAAEDAEELREHLASCRRCQAILRVEHFAGQASEEISLKSEQEAVLEAVVACLEPSQKASGNTPRRQSEARRQHSGRWLALAAALAMAVFGSLWVGQFRKAEKLEILLEGLKAPTSVDVYSLLPRDFKVREGQGSPRPLNSIRCLEGGKEAVWIIPTGQMIREGQKVEVAILRDGLELWRGSLFASRQGTIDLRLPAAFLVPGELEVRLKPESGSGAVVFDVLYSCKGS